MSYPEDGLGGEGLAKKLGENAAQQWQEDQMRDGVIWDELKEAHGRGWGDLLKPARRESGSGDKFLEVREVLEKTNPGLWQSLMDQVKGIDLNLENDVVLEEEEFEGMEPGEVYLYLAPGLKSYNQAEFDRQETRAASKWPELKGLVLSFSKEDLDKYLTYAPKLKFLYPEKFDKEFKVAEEIWEMIGSYLKKALDEALNPSEDPSYHWLNFCQTYYGALEINPTETRKRLPLTKDVNRLISNWVMSLREQGLNHAEAARLAQAMIPQNDSSAIRVYPDTWNIYVKELEGMARNKFGAAYLFNFAKILQEIQIANPWQDKRVGDI